MWLSYIALESQSTENFHECVSSVLFQRRSHYCVNLLLYRKIICSPKEVERVHVKFPVSRDMITLPTLATKTFEGVVDAESTTEIISTRHKEQSSRQKGR